MKKKIANLAVILVALFALMTVLVACEKKLNLEAEMKKPPEERLIGKWVITDEKLEDYYPEKMEINKNGKMVATVDGERLDLVWKTDKKSLDIYLPDELDEPAETYMFDFEILQLQLRLRGTPNAYYNRSKK